MTLFRNKSVLVLGEVVVSARLLYDALALTAHRSFSATPDRAKPPKNWQRKPEASPSRRIAPIGMPSSASREYGPLDILVVNAGVALFGDALEQDSDAIDRLFRINIHAPYHASVEAARNMPEGGRIIIIGSVNGDRMPVPGMAAYAASKSALQGLARGLARDFGPAGLR